MLLAAVHVRGDVADDARRGLEAVELPAGIGVHGLEIAFQRAVEDDVAGGRERAAPYRERFGVGPDDLPAAGVPGYEVAQVRAAGRRKHGKSGADVGLAGGVGHLERLVVHADVVGRHVEQAGPRREGRRLLVLGAERGRTDVGGVHVLAVVVGRVARDHLRAAGIHIDVGRPVDRGIVFLGDQQLSRLAVERVAEAVAVEVDHRLARRPADVDVGQDHLVDAVIVPFVVGRHLIDPFRHAVVGAAGEDGHGPAVVAGALHRVPRAGVARAVIEQVQFGIVRIPAPRGAAADLPLVAFPGVDA